MTRIGAGALLLATLSSCATQRTIDWHEAVLGLDITDHPYANAQWLDPATDRIARWIHDGRLTKVDRVVRLDHNHETLRVLVGKRVAVLGYLRTYPDERRSGDRLIGAISSSFWTRVYGFATGRYSSMLVTLPGPASAYPPPSMMDGFDFPPVVLVGRLVVAPLVIDGDPIHEVHIAVESTHRLDRK